MAKQEQRCYECNLSKYCDVEYPAMIPPCARLAETAPFASTNTARDETATRLLKCFVSFWHSDDTEPNDVALVIVETEKFLSDVAVSPVA